MKVSWYEFYGNIVDIYYSIIIQPVMSVMDKIVLISCITLLCSLFTRKGETLREGKNCTQAVKSAAGMVRSHPKTFVSV
jgi:hypothetical protein